MDTLKVFEATEMYAILLNLCNMVDLNHHLDKFKYASPFWQSDETSYRCFLSVLENEFDLFKGQKITRNKTLIIKKLITEITDMLLEYIPDDDSQAPLDSRCVVCLFNIASIKLKCNHTILCKKCFNVMETLNLKTCPICRFVY